MIIENIDVVPAHFFVYADETHIKQSECRRRYGYSSEGDRAIVGRWQYVGTESCSSALVSMSIEGVMSVSTFVTNEMESIDFLHALQFDILVHMLPFPNPRSILVLDNAHCTTVNAHCLLRVTNLKWSLCEL